MKSIIVKEGVENIDIEEWSHFVNNHPKGSIFQSYDIYITELSQVKIHKRDLT